MRVLSLPTPTFSVLVVSQYFRPETFRINDVVDGLVAAGCKVTVLTGQPNYPEGKVFHGYTWWRIGREAPSDGLRIYRVPIVPRGRGGAIQLVANYLSFLLSASVLLVPLLVGRRFDVICVYGVSPILQAIPAIIAKMVWRSPLIIWVQDLWPKSLEVTGFVRNRQVLGLVSLVTRWIYRRADLLLVPSRSFVDEVRRDAFPTPVEYLPNPAEVVSPTSGSVAGAGLPAPFSVVFAGNIGKAQALDVAVSAAKLLEDDPEIGLVLVGTGSALSTLQERVQEEGLKNVHFLGRFPPEAMPAIYASAGALLVSLVRDEALAVILPSKVPTYLAAAKPILAALSGEGAQVIEDSGAGIVVAQEDAGALATAIRQLKALGPMEREKLGAKGRKYFEENYELQSIVGQFVQRFDRLSGRAEEKL